MPHAQQQDDHQNRSRPLTMEEILKSQLRRRRLVPDLTSRPSGEGVKPDAGLNSDSDEDDKGEKATRI